MAGLLEKDIRLLWGTKQTLVILFAIAVAVAFSGNGNFIIGYLPFVVEMIAISTIAYDEMDHGYQFLLTLPINKKTYVREKYLLCAGGVVAAWVIAVCLYLVSKVVRGIPVVVAEDMLTAAVILLIILLISFFMIPAQIKFGFSVNTWAVGDLVQVVNSISDGDISALVDEYESSYRLTPAAQVHGEKRQNVLDAARIELGMKRFLEQGGFHAFTTTFEDLHGLKQLPGLAVQRLMQQGYGFAGEGDWKTAALLRIMKVMSTGLQGGTSFMEDYTYHFDNGNDLVLGSHMLEVCPTIATAEKPILDVQPLGIGGKADPARLIFNTQTGPAIVASLIDLGDRFRLLVNTIETVPTPHDLPKLPVANALWKAQPDLRTASEAWIIAGGAHHTVFSHALNLDDMRQFAELHDIELTVIDNDTRLPSFKDALRWNEVYYGSKR